MITASPPPHIAEEEKIDAARDRSGLEHSLASGLGKKVSERKRSRGSERGSASGLALIAAPLPVRIIERKRNFLDMRLGELWEYRELVGLLAWRDIAVRYKQTYVGAAWAILQPIGMLVAFSVVLRRWAHMPSEGVPYPLFAYVALLPWLYFSTAMGAAAGSLLKNANLVSKVRFPRLILPIAAVIPPLIDFIAAFLVLGLMSCFYGVSPSFSWLLIPFFLLLAAMLALASGIWLSALSIRFRDLSQCLPFITQMWMFASPIVYPSAMVSTRWRELYSLNPMVAISEGCRSAILGTHAGIVANNFLAVAVTSLLLISGVIYFQYVERSMADHI
jgi:lipopolysaccharide transport system permease protein